ncbi:MAG TPA: Bax inhibitor-1/YccA family protein [Humisphaera sp.]
MSRYPQQPNQNPYGRQPPPIPVYAQDPTYRNQSMPPSPQGLGYQNTYDQVADGAMGRFFNTVYAWMAVGLGVTAVVGFLFSQNTALLTALYGSTAGYLVVSLAAFGIAWYVQSQVGRLSQGVATALFLVYASILGALLSGIFIIYSPAVLVSAFAVTGGVFGAMSIYGFVTKRDLSRIGSIAIMIAFGLIIASVVNLFMANSALSWVITYGILAVFIVITAYETQMLKAMAEQTRHDPVMAGRVAIVGSLMLYISFINLFLSILRILGDRR